MSNVPSSLSLDTKQYGNLVFDLDSNGQIPNSDPYVAMINQMTASNGTVYDLINSQYYNQGAVDSSRNIQVYDPQFLTNDMSNVPMVNFGKYLTNPDWWSTSTGGNYNIDPSTTSGYLVPDSDISKYVTNPNWWSDYGLGETNSIGVSQGAITGMGSYGNQNVYGIQTGDPSGQYDLGTMGYVDQGGVETTGSYTSGGGGLLGKIGRALQPIAPIINAVAAYISPVGALVGTIIGSAITGNDISPKQLAVMAAGAALDSSGLLDGTTIDTQGAVVEAPPELDATGSMATSPNIPTDVSVNTPNVPITPDVASPTSPLTDISNLAKTAYQALPSTKDVALSIGQGLGLTEGAGALTVGNAVLGAGINALVASATGGDIQKSALTGAIGAGISTNASDIATSILGKDNLQTIADATKLSTAQVAGLFTNAISTGIMTGAQGGNVINAIETNLASSAIGNYAGNVVNMLDPGNINAAVSVASGVAKVGAATALNGGDIGLAITNALPQIIGNTTFSQIKGALNQPVVPDYTNDVPYSPNGASQPLPVNTTPSNDVSTNTQTSDTTSPLNQVASTTAESPVNQTIAPLTQLASEQPTQKVDLTTPSPLLSTVTQPITTPDTTYAPLASTNTTGTVSDVGGGTPLVPINNGNTTKDEVTIIDPSTGKSSNSNVAIPSDATPVEGNPNEYQGADGTTYTIDPTTGNVSSTPPPIDISTSNPLDTPPNPPYQDGTISAQNTSSDTGGTNPVGSNDSSGSSSSGTSNQPSVDLTPINNQLTDLSKGQETLTDDQLATQKQLDSLSDDQKALVKAQTDMGVSLSKAISNVQASITKQAQDQAQATQTQQAQGALSSLATQSAPPVTNPSTIVGTSLAGQASYGQGNSKILADLKQLYPQLSQVNPKLLSQLGLSQDLTPKEAPLSKAIETAQTNPILSTTSFSSDFGLPKLTLKSGGLAHIPEFITGHTGHYASGKGDGQSDDIKALLNDGDYVIDAEAVAQLGNGSSKAGKDVLERFRASVPHKQHHVSGGKVPAMIADGEYVLPSSFVSALGGGDSDVGAKKLDKMREALRQHKRSAPLNKIPPKSKSPLEYLRDGFKMKEKR